MPLIVAIEPDRRQAQQLTGVVCKRLHADVLLAESAERALAELGDRVPDLILTSALLSPNDEVLLGERLRALDGAASHVQTLTIPVLAAARPRKRSRSGGVLSVLGLGKSEEDSSPEGCDPTVFAAQCAEYLERAVAEHAINAATAESHDETVSGMQQRIVNPLEQVRDSIEPIDETADWRYGLADPIAEPTAPLDEARAPSAELFETMTAPSAEPFEPTAALSAEAFEPMTAGSENPFEPIGTSIGQSAEPGRRLIEPVEPVRERVAPRMPVFINAPAATATVQEAIAQVEAFVAREALAAETIAKIEAAQLADDQASKEPVDPAEEPVDSDVPDDFIDLDLSTLLEDEIRVGPSVESAAQSEGDETDVYDISVFGKRPPADVPAIAPAMFAHARVTSEASEAVPPTPVRALNDAEVWTPARLGVRQLWPAMDGGVSKSSSVVAGESDRVRLAARTPSNRAQARRKPIQDEWGFFDPEQCGFAALLAKLDEILEADDQRA
jgi:hypothetical protein